MLKHMRTKTIVCIVIAFVYIVASACITKRILNELDTKMASDIAIEQMNYQEEGNHYETYRNLRNDIHTYSFVITTGIILITIAGVFIPDIVENCKKEEEITNE